MNESIDELRKILHLPDKSVDVQLSLNSSCVEVTSGSHDLFNLLFQKHIFPGLGKTPIYHFSDDKKVSSVELLFNYLSKDSLLAFCQKHFYGLERKSFNETYFFLSENTLSKFESHQNRGELDAEVTLYTFSENVYEEIQKIFASVVLTEKREGSVLFLMEDGGRLSFEEVGIAGKDLVEDNYQVEVVKKYKNIVQSIENREFSHGRFILLDGKPGTGKTFFIRGLLQDIKNAHFVFISSEFIPMLAGSKLANIILRFQREYLGEGETFLPVVFIIEDADSNIVTRMTDNMSSINTLLNVTDGIIGDLFNLYVIASTNAKSVDVDKALLRPGRMLEHVTFNEFSRDEARQILTRLGSKKVLLDSKYTLAQLYHEADGGSI